MRNNHIFFKNNAVALAEKLCNRRNKKEIKRTKRNYRTLRHRQAL